MEALGFLMALTVAVALLILPVLTFVFVMNVRNEQREQRKLRLGQLRCGDRHTRVHPTGRARHLECIGR